MSGEPEPLPDPFVLFEQWFAEARAKEINDPNAMALATSDADGLPNVRMVLMKDISPEGVVFYTNTESAKGTEILANPQAAVVFHWKSLRRQVRFRGKLARVSDSEADAYFASRPRDSRIGAWASQQSRPLEDRFALEKAVARETLRFGLGEVQRPPHWTGFRLTPIYIEFWQDKPFRLHDRLVFRRRSASGAFSTERLYP
ncbi:MAG: pyridoxamine 5'-phosphate oxidase [Rhizobiales bacterium]|nr:pyridoxamine 5'-phosphate oxidase [Hyphomicrobiales bacterium]